jgi:hypothetical protein
LSLKRCYELTNGYGRVIRLIEDSKALIITCCSVEQKSIEIILSNAEINELMKAIDMLRPERPLEVKENPLKANK